MKTRILTALSLFGCLALASAQTIPNPSFEANSFTNYPGYISVNVPIIGWTSGDTNRAGLNPVTTGGPPNPFADNGAIPNGTNVAFIQSLGGISSLSTVLSNLTVVHRMIYTYREAKALEDAQLRAVKEPVPPHSDF